MKLRSKSKASMTVLTVAILSGCVGYADPELIQQQMAQYAVRPQHKAAYWIKLPNRFALPYVWGYNNADEATNAAKKFCEKMAAEQGVGPEKCIAVSIDDVVSYDPVPGAIAAKQQALQDADENDQLIQQLPSIIQGFRSQTASKQASSGPRTDGNVGSPLT